MRVLILRDRKKLQCNSFKETVEIEERITIILIEAENNVRLLWENREMLPYS